MGSRDNFEIKQESKGKLPRLPFVKMKNRVLGARYELSLVFASSSLSRKLNRTYRKKDKPTDVLSFPISKNSGEIFIDMKVAAREAKLFRKSPKNFIGILFIHALLHLKGYKHGSTMDKEEEKIRRIFGL